MIKYNCKINICSFANLYLHPTLTRFRRQAREMSVFDNIFLYTEYDLDDDFRNKFSDILNSETRGFGYWIWKPYIILKSLEKMETGDILVYADAGCHLNAYALERFYEYINLTMENDFLAVDNNSLDRIWTKSDLFEYFGVLNEPNILDTKPISATAMFIKKSDRNIEIIKKWLQVYYDDLHLIDDSPSIIPNAKDFIEHRHDQSVFSILSKLYDIKYVDHLEFINGVGPIQYKRDKKDHFSYSLDKIVWFIPVLKWRDAIRNKCFKEKIIIKHLVDSLFRKKLRPKKHT